MHAQLSFLTVFQDNFSSSYYISNLIYTKKFIVSVTKYQRPTIKKYVFPLLSPLKRLRNVAQHKDQRVVLLSKIRKIICA